MKEKPQMSASPTQPPPVPTTHTWPQQGNMPPVSIFAQQRWENGERNENLDSDSDESKKAYLCGNSALNSSAGGSDVVSGSVMEPPMGGTLNEAPNNIRQSMVLLGERCLRSSAEKGKGTRISSVWILAIDGKHKQSLRTKLSDAQYHWWSQNVIPAKLSLQPDAKVSRLLSCLDKQDPEAEGYHLEEGFKIHCVMEEPSLRRWPWLCEGPHKNRFYNINATFRVFSVDGGNVDAMKHNGDEQPWNDFFIRSAFESFCFFGTKTKTGHCFGAIDVQKYEAFRVWADAKYLTDTSFVEHVHRAHVDPSFSANTGIRLDSTGNVVEFLEKHIRQHSNSKRNVLMISEAASSFTASS
jgi:hypothetical protein